MASPCIQQNNVNLPAGNSVDAVSSTEFTFPGECYVAAKKALHRGPPDRLVCREKELSIVQGFLNSHVSKSRPGSMYISGVPGTGKNAVLCCALKQIEVSETFTHNIEAISCLQASTLLIGCVRTVVLVAGRDEVHSCVGELRAVQELCVHFQHGAV